MVYHVLCLIMFCTSSLRDPEHRKTCRWYKIVSFTEAYLYSPLAMVIIFLITEILHQFRLLKSVKFIAGKLTKMTNTKYHVCRFLHSAHYRLSCLSSFSIIASGGRTAHSKYKRCSFIICQLKVQFQRSYMSHIKSEL